MQYLSSEEAVEFIKHGQTIGIGGFTSAGAPRTIAHALSKKAEDKFNNNEEFKINIVAGASTCSEFDSDLTKFNAISWRIPYQGDRVLRSAINKQQVKYLDLHLSQVSEMLAHGIFGEIDVAIIEVSEFIGNNKAILTTAIGLANSLCKYAKKIIFELRSDTPYSLYGIHDIPSIEYQPGAAVLNLSTVNQRIGKAYLEFDPSKVIGVVKNTMLLESCQMAAVDDVTKSIGQRIADFLVKDKLLNTFHKHALPIQVGVGNVANALFGALYENSEIKPIDMFSEVLQDSNIDGLLTNKIRFASGGCLPTSQSAHEKLWNNYSALKNRLLLRPMEITNHPDIIRRLGVIAINTALEVDVWGNVNSTHVCGRNVMNGIGGSADFSRNAYLSIFATPSSAKGGKISAIVPLCSHIDHIEHDVDIIVTEHGLADLRGKDPSERAELIISNCAHPRYRDLLLKTIDRNSTAHIPLNLDLALSFHRNFLASGSMQ